MKSVVIIPARYGSTRFPGKPLALLGGSPVIEHVYRRALSVCADTFVATDDKRIADVVSAFGGQVIMTGTHHKSGTDRVAEAVSKLASDYDVIVNIQGDEPFVIPEQITSLIDAFSENSVEIATLSTFCTNDDEITDPNNVKVVVSNLDNALYFSRSCIPYFRNMAPGTWAEQQLCRKHVGIYAYRPQILSQLTTLSQSSLEQAEQLEQLRWLQAGYTIRVIDTPFTNIGIDTPEDLIIAEQLLLKGE